MMMETLTKKRDDEGDATAANGGRSRGKREPKSISLGELFELDIPTREYLIVPWMRQGESVMVYAAPGVGKTLFAMSLALAVAGGGKLLNTWDTGGNGKSRKVLYIDGEMPMDDIRERAKMLLPSALTEGGNMEAVKENLSIMARQHQKADAWFIDLAREESQEYIVEQARMNGIELVILDNLSTLATIDDENAASSFNDTIKFLLKMKQAGIACLLVHHAGKAVSGGYRGSSKIATTFEAIIQLTQTTSHEDDACDTTRFLLSWEKYRGKRDESTGGQSLEACLKRNEEGNAYTWQTTRLINARIQTMLELLKTEEYETGKEIAKAMNINEVELTRLKSKAIEQELITGREWKACLGRAKGERGKSMEPAGKQGNPDF